MYVFVCLLTTYFRLGTGQARSSQEQALHGKAHSSPTAREQKLGKGEKTILLTYLITLLKNIMGAEYVYFLKIRYVS